MLAARGYATKKELKAAKGTRMRYTETSLFSLEFKAPSTFAVVGPSAYQRKWFAEVTVDAAGIITHVK